MEDYYAHLEIGHDATAADIRAAYRRLALKWHPDKNPEHREEANQKFKQIAAAYEVLNDPGRRAEYDRGELPGQTRAARTDGNGPRFSFNTFPSNGGQPFEYMFRNPQDIFRDFFKNDPFFHGSFFGTPDMSMWTQLPPVSGGFNASVFSSSPNTESFSMASTTTMVNGKLTETRTRVVNNTETTDIFENGVLISSTTRNRNAAGGNPSNNRRISSGSSSVTHNRRNNDGMSRRH